jgi:hypothetical protein
MGAVAPHIFQDLEDGGILLVTQCNSRGWGLLRLTYFRILEDGGILLVTL